MPDVSYADQLKAAERELALRHHVYARRVADKKMTQALADREIAAMSAIVETLRRLAEQDRLL